ncbi:MAG: response regulator, partial [Chloroflexota bacterium]
MDERPSILIVDDDEGVRRTLEMILTKKNYQPVTAPDGKTALALAEERFFNLALLDIRLPDIAGTDLLAQLKTRHPDLEALIITGHATLETAIQALSSGAYHYFIKPINVDELLVTLNRALDKQRLVIENRRLLEAVQKELEDRKRAEEALATERNLLRTLVANLPDRVYVKDAAGRFLLNNPAHLQALGAQSQEEAIGKTDFDFRSHELAERYLADDREVLQSGNPLVNREEPSPLPSGEQRWILVSKVPLRDKQGNIAGLVGISRDITERKRGEERVSRIADCFLNFGPDVLENINRLTALCGELLGADWALYNRLDQGLLCSWGQWHVPPGYNLVDQPQGHLCYDVIQHARDQALVVRHLPETPYAQTDPNVLPYQSQTYIGRVVKLSEQAIGSLCVVYQRDVAPSAEDEQVMGVIASAIAVEEARKRAEAAQHAAETNYRSLFENVPDGVYRSTP